MGAVSSELVSGVHPGREQGIFAVSCSNCGDRLSNSLVSRGKSGDFPTLRNREFSGGNRENQFVEQGRPVLYACTGCAANRSIDPDNGVPVGGWGSRRDYRAPAASSL